MQTLRAWLTANDVHLDHRLDLVQQHDGEGGCSVWANDDIDEGVTVARIPKSLVLSHRSSSLSPLLAELPPSLHPLRDALHSSPPPLRLAVHVLHELLLGEKSRWATYFAFCPPFRGGGEGDEALAVPIAVLWEEEGEARRWVRGTQLERELQRREVNKQSLTTFYHSLVHPLLSSLPTTTSPLYTLPLTLPLFLHSHLLTSTRSFLVDSTSYHSLALVPLADLFNHEQEGVHNCQFVSEPWVCGECGAVGACEHDGEEDASRPTPLQEEEKVEEDTCDLLTTSPLLAGEEAFNHYGPRLSNAKLAMEYGFRVEANEWDVVQWEGVGEVLRGLVGGRGEGVEVEERWRALLEQGDFLRGEEEDDHPLIAPFPSSSSSSVEEEADRTALLVDADARLSPALWVLLVLLASSSPASSSSTPTSAKLAALTTSLRWLAEREEDEAEEEEEEGGEDGVSEEDLTLLRRVSGMVRRLVDARVQQQREPGLSGGELLEEAEIEKIPATRLAIEFLAGERLLLERVQQNWTFP